jgi:hypothetical protein
VKTEKWSEFAEMARNLIQQIFRNFFRNFSKNFQKNFGNFENKF